MSSEVGNDWKAMKYMVVSYGEIFFRINVTTNYSYCPPMENFSNSAKKECNQTWNFNEKWFESIYVDDWKKYERNDS